jgi:hypothetical protein
MDERLMRYCEKLGRLRLAGDAKCLLLEVVLMGYMGYGLSVFKPPGRILARWEARIGDAARQLGGLSSRLSEKMLFMAKRFGGWGVLSVIDMAKRRLVAALLDFFFNARNGEIRRLARSTVRRSIEIGRVWCREGVLVNRDRPAGECEQGVYFLNWLLDIVGEWGGAVWWEEDRWEPDTLEVLEIELERFEGEVERCYTDGGMLEGDSSAAVWRREDRRGVRVQIGTKMSSTERELMGIWLASITEAGRKVVTDGWSAVQLLLGWRPGWLDKRRASPALLARVGEEVWKKEGRGGGERFSFMYSHHEKKLHKDRKKWGEKLEKLKEQLGGVFEEDKEGNEAVDKLAGKAKGIGVFQEVMLDRLYVRHSQLQLRVWLEERTLDGKISQRIRKVQEKRRMSTVADLDVWGELARWMQWGRVNKRIMRGLLGSKGGGGECDW